MTKEEIEIVAKVAKRLSLIRTLMWCAALTVSASLLSFTLRVEWEKDRQLKRDCYASNERMVNTGASHTSNFCR